MTGCMLEDLAYILGLTCGRGRLDYNSKELSIEFPFRSMTTSGISQEFNQREQLIIGIDNIIDKMADFTGKQVKKIRKQSQIEIVVAFYTDTQTWQSITRFFNKKDSFQEFIIPDDFFHAPKEIKRNFLKGLADVAGFVTRGNVDQSGRYRVYIEIPFRNWNLPTQICSLLQGSDINIPVQTITWGHPNMRGKGAWSKEHQIKIYAEYFTQIGFTIDYKHQMLEEFANANIDEFGLKPPSFCDPTSKRVRIKPLRVDESSDKLDARIKGKHFNSFWEICCELGCNRCDK